MKFNFMFGSLFFCYVSLISIQLCLSKRAPTVQSDDYPWFFAIANSSKKVLCGAVLIDSEFAVASASCLQGIPTNQLFISNNKERHELKHISFQDNVALLQLRDASSLPEMFTSLESDSSNCYFLHWKADKEHSDKSKLVRKTFKFDNQTHNKVNSLVICDEGFKAIVGRSNVTYISDYNDGIDEVFKCVIANRESCTLDAVKPAKKHNKNRRVTTTAKPLSLNITDCSQTINCIQSPKNNMWYPVFLNKTDEFSCSFNEYERTKYGYTNPHYEKPCYKKNRITNHSRNYFCQCSFDKIENNLEVAKCERFCDKKKFENKRQL